MYGCIVNGKEKKNEKEEKNKKPYKSSEKFEFLILLQPSVTNNNSWMPITYTKLSHHAKRRGCGRGVETKKKKVKRKRNWIPGVANYTLCTENGFHCRNGSRGSRLRSGSNVEENGGKK